MSSFISTMVRGFIALAIAAASVAFCGRADAQGPPEGTLILHVDGDGGSITGNGSDWGTSAFKFLQDGIDKAVLELQNDPDIDTVWIWVAATDPGNPYRPDRSAADPDGTRDRHAAFQVHSGISLFGGFQGFEDNLAEADPEAYPTVLTGAQHPSGTPPECGDPDAGDCFDPDNPTPECDDPYCCSYICAQSGFEYCCFIGWDTVCAARAAAECPGDAYHVVTGFGLGDVTARLEGFTITGGVADGLGDDEKRGGGVFLDTAGGIGVEKRPVFVRCTITGNSASEGAGMYAVDNPTGQGGVYPQVIDCAFIANEAEQDGGGVHIGVKAGGTFVNCLFADNEAGNHGGAMYMLGNKLQELINCTISGNTADADSSGSGDAGGVFVDQTLPTIVTIDNCILWANTDSGLPGETAQLTVLDMGVGGSVTVGHSDLDGTALPPDVADGGGNIFDDPEFVDPSGDDYRLRKLCSPCIDAGSNTPVPDDVYDVDHDGFDDEEKTPDLDVQDRVLDGLDLGSPVVDMGVYEFVRPSCPWDCHPDGNVGINDFLDLLAQWGMECSSCDFGVGAPGVGINDSLALLAHWGPCDGQPESPPQSVQDCINRFGTEDPLVLQHCICAVSPCEEGCPPGPTCP